MMEREDGGGAGGGGRSLSKHDRLYGHKYIVSQEGGFCDKGLRCTVWLLHSEREGSVTDSVWMFYWINLV